MASEFFMRISLSVCGEREKKHSLGQDGGRFGLKEKRRSGGADEMTMGMEDTISKSHGGLKTGPCVHIHTMPM
jgi:hypothetical protein